MLFYGCILTSRVSFVTVLFWYVLLPWLIRGDPRGRIRCIGPVASIRTTLPPPEALFDMQPINTERYFQSALELCAKVDYGGDLTWNAGAFCSWTAEPPTVVFELEKYVTPSGMSDIAYEAIQMFCSFRCRCLSPYADPDTESSGASTQTDLGGSEQDLTALAEPYDKNPQRSPFSDPVLLNGFFDDQYVTAFFHSEMFTAEAAFTKSLQPPPGFSTPICDGDVPGWLPLPFSPPDFYSVRQLCAAQWFGGSAEGNAGGVCINGHYFYLLAYLAHPSLLITNIPLGMAVDAFCTWRCRCVMDLGSAPRQKRFTIPYVKAELREYEAISDFRNGGVILWMTAVSGGDWTPVTLTPPQNGAIRATSPQGTVTKLGGVTCGLVKQDSCTELWPEHFKPILNKLILDASSEYLQTPSGRYRRARKGVPRQRASIVPKNNHVCGVGGCVGNRDCSPGSDGSSCRCVDHPTPLQLLHIGLNPMYPNPSSICMSTDQISFVNAAYRASGGLSLGKRGVENRLACRCNETNVSESCCESMLLIA